MNYKEYLTHFKNVVDVEVEGWFYPIDIIMLCGLLSEIQKFKGDVCEIGVAYGKSAICLSQFRKLKINYICMIFSVKKLNRKLLTISENMATLTT